MFTYDDDDDDDDDEKIRQKLRLKATKITLSNAWLSQSPSFHIHAGGLVFREGKNRDTLNPSL